MDALDERTRLLLFHGSPLPVASALVVDLRDVGMLRLREMGIKADNLRAASIGPVLLREAGVHAASELRALGLDALDLRDAGFASQAIACYGTADTVEAFLCSAADAVSIVGSSGCDLLCITPELLLRCTAGEPGAAHSVISELKSNALSEVSLDTLMSTGIQIDQLASVGYSLNLIVSLFSPNSEQLQIMGVKTRLLGAPGGAFKQ
jgi:hypothetical protein